MARGRSWPVGLAPVVAEGLAKSFPAPLRLCGLELGPLGRPGKPVLRDISFAVSAGEVVGIAGPNGAGKTTLLRVLATLVRPTAGRAWVGGYDVVRASLLARRSLGVAIGGGRGFSPRLTAAQNLAFAAALRGLPHAQALCRTAEVLELVGLGAHRRRPVGEFSAGMLQRLALARALLAEVPVLLLDEPMRSLDASATRRVGELLRRLAAAGKAIVLTAPDAGALRWCDRCLRLRGGRLG